MTFYFLAQSAPAAAPSGIGTFILPMIAIFILFYFIIQRPQQRERTQRENMLSQIGKGDEVVTIGGICGKVDSVDKKKNRVTLLVDKNSRITFLRGAIDRIERKKGEKAPADGGDDTGSDEKSES